MNTLDQALNYPYAQYDGHFLYINGKSTPISPPPGAPQAMLLNILDLHDLFHRRNITMERPEHWVSLISFGFCFSQLCSGLAFMIIFLGEKQENY